MIEAPLVGRKSISWILDSGIQRCYTDGSADRGLNDQLGKVKSSTSEGNCVVSIAEQSEMDCALASHFTKSWLIEYNPPRLYSGNQLSQGKVVSESNVHTDNGGRWFWPNGKALYLWINDKAEFTPKPFRPRWACQYGHAISRVEVPQWAVIQNRNVTEKSTFLCILMWLRSKTISKNLQLKAPLTAVDQVFLWSKKGELFGLIGTRWSRETSIFPHATRSWFLMRYPLRSIVLDVVTTTIAIREKWVYFARQNVSAYQDSNVGKISISSPRLFNNNYRRKLCFDQGNLCARRAFKNPESCKLSEEWSKKLALCCALDSQAFRFCFWNEPTTVWIQFPKGRFWDMLKRLKAQDYDFCFDFLIWMRPTLCERNCLDPKEENHVHRYARSIIQVFYPEAAFRQWNHQKWVVLLGKIYGSKIWPKLLAFGGVSSPSHFKEIHR